MNNVISTIQTLVSGLTSIFVGIIALGVVAGIVFGDSLLIIGDVVGNLTSLVQGLGESGLVGLIVAIILIGLFDSK
jgi:hypothetical protein